MRVSDDLNNKNFPVRSTNRNLALFLVYMVMITVLTLLYDYPETLFKRPQSIHNWRQCDGASIALNYYQEGMHFFRPQTHMLYSDNYTTGYSAPSEIPFLYYFVAILYKIFGYHEFLFRGVNLLIFYVGLFYLFRLADAVLKDMVYATVVTLLIFSAPVLVYYANNYMPNTVALSFSFIGWYYFHSYYIKKTTKTFLLSALFLGIASSMKITEATGPVIVLALIIADRLKIIRLDLATDRQFLFKAGTLLMIFVVTGAWIWYARHYNSHHGSVQFMTYPIPIWKMNGGQIKNILHLINVLWFKEYFYPATFWFMIGGILIMIIWWRQSDKILRLVCIAQFAALILFSLMWFRGLGEHDYFYIGFYVLPALLFINFFVVVKNTEFSKLNLSLIRFVFLAVTVINVFYAQKRHTLRYTSWMNDYEQKKDLYTITPFLRESGITDKSRIIFYPSVYIRPLYLMNVKGWTIFDHSDITPDIVQRDSSQMALFSSKGAEYFITSDIKSAASYEPFRPYMKDLYAKYKSIFIFRLPPVTENFNAEEFAENLK